MTTQPKEQLQQTIATFDLLSSLFLTLPNQALVNSLLDGNTTANQTGGSEGLHEIATWCKQQQSRDREEVLLDLARDRVMIMRGVKKDAVAPPYESLYVGQKDNVTIGSLNRFYSEHGYTLDKELKEAPEQLGVELAFAKLLLERELEALNIQDEAQALEAEETYQSFLAQHLSRWAGAYGTAMAREAKTGFYRGIGLLIAEILPASHVAAA